MEVRDDVSMTICETGHTVLLWTTLHTSSDSAGIFPITVFEKHSSECSMADAHELLQREYKDNGGVQNMPCTICQYVSGNPHSGLTTILE